MIPGASSVPAGRGPWAWWGATGGLLLLAVVGAGQDAAVRDQFALTLADGSTATGPLAAIGEAWTVQLGGAPPIQATGEQILDLRRRGVPRPAMPRGEQVIFANGDRLPAQVLKLSGDRLRVRTAVGRDVDLLLPLSALAVIWAAAPDQEDYPERWLRRLLAARRTKDVVYLRNGDVIEGLLTGLEDRSRLRIKAGKKEVQVAFDKVAAVALNTTLVRSLRPKAVYGKLVLANGGRLSLAAARADGQTLTGKTLFGPEVAIPVKQVMALDLFQGRAVYLSDLKPKGYETTPYLDVARRYVADGSVLGNDSPTGGDLHLPGGTYDKGIGMHSPGRLTFDLGGNYRRFEALVGLDEETGRLGSARARVVVDGKPYEVAGAEELTSRTGPRKVKVDVTGARELTLVVETARFADVQGHVNWVDARLVK
jgi:hypothetical protein